MKRNCSDIRLSSNMAPEIAALQVFDAASSLTNTLSNHDNAESEHVEVNAQEKTNKFTPGKKSLRSCLLAFVALFLTFLTYVLNKTLDFLSENSDNELMWEALFQFLGSCNNSDKRSLTPNV